MLWAISDSTGSLNSGLSVAPPRQEYAVQCIPFDVQYSNNFGLLVDQYATFHNNSSLSNSRWIARMKLNLVHGWDHLARWIGQQFLQMSNLKI